jgi:polysaccharide biosynthesis transport protein
VRSPAEAKLAGAMIGIGLQQAGQNVLVVEFSGQPRGSELNAGVFINGASGLPTIVRPLPAGKNSDAFALGQELAGDFDFVLLLGPPLTDPDWDATLFGPTDLMLFALAAAENAVQAIDQLRQRLAAEDISRSATLVITTEAAGAEATPLQGAGP